MREIMFRGKRTEYGEWVHGYLIGDDVIVGDIVEFNDEYFNTSFWYKVVPETVGQRTGLKDKNGKEIYEGDILSHPPTSEWERKNFVAFEVFYHDNDCADHHVGFQMNRLHFQGSIGGYSIKEKFLPKHTGKLEIIGDIHTTPELLKEASA